MGFTKILRTATVIAICLWLALPSSHALALCIDSEGSVALEVAIDGACTGSRAGGAGSGRSAERGVDLTADAYDCCGGCTDVVLGRDGVVIPAQSVSGKQRPARPIEKVADAADAPRISPPIARGATASGPCAPISERSPIRDSVVLRL
jgi:hypothetical protein